MRETERATASPRFAITSQPRLRMSAVSGKPDSVGRMRFGPFRADASPFLFWRSDPVCGYVTFKNEQVMLQEPQDYAKQEVELHP